MKGNFLKIVFLILIIILICIAVYNNFFKKAENIIAEKINSNYEEKIHTTDNIRIGIIEFDNMNPILSNNKNVQDISRLIFDPLFTLSEDYKLEECLATECSKIEERTYVIKLRENVKWQDGNKFDASDVMFTIDMLKNKENNSIYYYNVANISSTEQLDEYTIKITIDKDVKYFEYNLIFPIVSSKYFDTENFKLESKNIKPAGTGVYYISEASTQSILLKKNVNGWNSKKIKLDTITLNLYDSLSSAINAYRSGEIDMFTTSNRKIDEYLKNTNYNKKEYINRNYDYLTLNCTNNILEDKAVRQAINSAINKEEILKDVYNGKYIQSNFPLDFGSYVYDKNNSYMQYDPNTAKRLLLDNGWKYSAKKWRKNINNRYVSLELKILVDKTNSNLVKVAKKIKSQLESIGITVNLVQLEGKKYNSEIKNNKFDIALSTINYSYSPSLNKYFGDENKANYKNEEISNILNEIENIKNENELKQKYSRIVEIYNDEVPYISLYYNTNYIVYSPNLKGTVSPNSYNLFYGIENWYREYKK